MPPVAVTVIVALPPLQATGVAINAVAANAVGCVTFIVVVVEQLLASVTVYVCEPTGC